MKFKDLKPYVSRIDKLSICKYETMCYENFIRMRDVPDKYDDLYVYGVGMIESEFYQISKYEYSAHRGDGDLVLLNCIEIVLSEKPKEIA